MKANLTVNSCSNIKNKTAQGLEENDFINIENKSLDNATESENFPQIWSIIKKYIDEYGIKGGGQSMNKNCLNLFTIKDMAKIRYYLYLNIKNELNYESKEKSEKEPRSLVQGNDSEDKELEIPNEEIYVLIVNEMVDLNNQHLMWIMMI
nr:7052_t:CDS:2 [Entrophospora candida]